MKLDEEIYQKQEKNEHLYNEIIQFKKPKPISTEIIDNITIQKYKKQKYHSNDIKSNRPIQHRKKSLSKKIKNLTTDLQLYFFNDNVIHNRCSVELWDNSPTNYDDERKIPFLITINPYRKSILNETEYRTLLSIAFQKGQKYYNTKNHRKLRDFSTLPDIEVNICQETNGFLHIHLKIKSTIRELLIYLFYINEVFRARYGEKKDMIEFHNIIDEKTSDLYVEEQTINTFYAKDLFKLQ